MPQKEIVLCEALLELIAENRLLSRAFGCERSSLKKPAGN